jgi:hypothetical protein
MNTIFPGYYRPSKEAFKELWQKATIALDANVMLNLYRYPTSARDDLLTTLRQVSNRLFVPYQAALEYQRGRLGTIGSQQKRFGEVRKILSEMPRTLEAQFDNLQLKKRHALINPDKLLAGVRELFDSFQRDLETLENGHPDVVDDDSIRDALDQILEGKVGPRPEQAELDTIYAQGKKRYSERTPPGYMDAAKANETEAVYTADGLRIERQYGDLLVWRQLLAAAAKRQTKQLILVTDDEKEDWWWRVNSTGVKTIGPRPELVDEIRREAGVVTFYMYNSERFVQYAKEYLRPEVKQESIEQIREALVAESEPEAQRRLKESEWAQAMAGLQMLRVDWKDSELAKTLAALQGPRLDWKDSEWAKTLAALQGPRLDWKNSEWARTLAALYTQRVHVPCGRCRRAFS